MRNGDLIGRRFGRLTVTEDSGLRKGNSVLWRCRCACGGEVLAVRHQLMSGTVQDCGCVARPARPQVTDLIGRRFGLLTVMGDSGLREGAGSIRWRCRCACGGETLATRRQLVSGNVASCGCVPKTQAPRRQAEDLAGRTFGELTVLRRAPNDKRGHVCWACRCSCGRETTLPALQLKSGKTQSCGCKKHAAPPNKRDLAGQRFGRLTALCPAPAPPRQKGSYWHCRCACGRELDVCTGSLVRGLTQSCGCQDREQSQKMHEHMHYQDDTCIEMLKRACATTGKNKAGFRGLFQMRDGRYRASITFRGRHYDLGHYASFARAVQARLEAEEVLHKGYINAFARYEEKAAADPAWAQANPFYYEVTQSAHDLSVQTNGQ